MTVAQQEMLQVLTRAVASKLAPQEAHAVAVLFAMAFGKKAIESTMFTQQVNTTRLELGLPEITQAVVGNPTTEQKLELFQSAMAKLGDEAHAVLIRLMDETWIRQQARTGRRSSDEAGA